MHISHKTFIGALLFVIAFIVVLFIGANTYEKPEEIYVAPHSEDLPGVTYTEYRMSSDTCVLSFGRPADEFFSRPYDFSWTEDFRTYSRLEDNGDLLLRLNEQQKNDWWNHYNEAIQLVKDRGVEVASDYTKVTLRGYKETIASMMMPVIFAMRGFHVRQVLNGTEADEVQIEVVVIDAGTDDVVYSVVQPQEPLHYSHEGYGLSSIHSK